MNKLTVGEKLFLAANLLPPKQLKLYRKAVKRAENNNKKKMGSTA